MPRRVQCAPRFGRSATLTKIPPYPPCRRPRRGVPAPCGAWTAIDSNSIMILSYEVGDRSGATVIEFMHDLLNRLANRVQLTTVRPHAAYLEAVEGAFVGKADFARLIKLYGDSTGLKGLEKRYSPADLHGHQKAHALLVQPRDIKRASTSSPLPAAKSSQCCLGMRRDHGSNQGLSFSKKISEPPAHAEPDNLCRRLQFRAGSSRRRCRIHHQRWFASAFAIRLGRYASWIVSPHRRTGCEARTSLDRSLGRAMPRES